MNQYGEVQAIGGVNEKIEGFFRLCEARGLTGDQGVIIPFANIRHLALKPEVVAAIEAKQFFIYGVKTVEEALLLLTGRDVGAPCEEHIYDKDSINHAVIRRLKTIAEMALDGQKDKEEEKNKN